MSASQPLLLSIDQGTTSSRAIIFDQQGNTHALAQQEFPQHYPQDGWVEHKPEDIWQSVVNVCQQAMQQIPDAKQVISIGITNQRETTLLWDKQTGRCLYNAIVWQDRRTAKLCEQLKASGVEPMVTEKTGLLLDPYFSATKLAWILDHVDNARTLAVEGRLAFGTVDTFLLWHLTQGKSHATDASNASRTLLFNIHTQQWDEELLSLFNIPANLLPDVKDCAADFGVTTPALFNSSIPINGIAGDQHAATIGQACLKPGMVKSTYGTGCFVMLNTGKNALSSKNRLLTTTAYRFNGVPTYALEGSIFIAGAAVQWLRDGLKLIEHASQTEALAQEHTDNNGVYMVPAFTGLGAPYWDAQARGAIFGLTRNTDIADIVRACLEAICYQTHDLFSAMSEDGFEPTTLRVDGGMVKNNWLMQFLSDILNIKTERPSITETTALGAAYIAGLHVGLYNSLDEIQNSWQLEKTFTPGVLDATRRIELLNGWQNAINRVRSTH